jgi:hypothetical protein
LRCASRNVWEWITGVRIAGVARVLGLGLLAGVVSAADWPCYMGPDRNGSSPEKGLARAWPAGGPRVLWTAPVTPR